MKREAGASPARTRHRNEGAMPISHWETGKTADATIFKSGDLPELRTKHKLKPRVTGRTEIEDTLLE